MALRQKVERLEKAMGAKRRQPDAWDEFLAAVRDRGQSLKSIVLERVALGNTENEGVPGIKQRSVTNAL